MEVTIPPVLTGPSLKAIRALRNISQAQLAELAEVSPTTIATFESGKSELRTGTILKICEALNVRVTYHVDSHTLTGP